MKDAPGKADLHVHTTHSDGHATVGEVLEYTASRTDVGVIAITDHDTIEGALEARDLAGRYGIEAVIGEEVSTADGELLALFIERRLPPGRPAVETIAEVRGQGGMCVAAHPYGLLLPSMGYRGLLERCSRPGPEWPLDAIETFNAGLWSQSTNTLAAMAAEALGLPGCGGSDSHHPKTIGYGFTHFPGRSAADLRVAIAQGQTRAAGCYWGLLRTAEVAALIARRTLRDTGRLVRGHGSKFPVPHQPCEPPPGEIASPYVASAEDPVGEVRMPAPAAKEAGTARGGEVPCRPVE